MKTKKGWTDRAATDADAAVKEGGRWRRRGKGGRNWETELVVLEQRRKRQSGDETEQGTTNILTNGTQMKTNITAGGEGGGEAVV